MYLLAMYLLFLSTELFCVHVNGDFISNFTCDMIKDVMLIVKVNNTWMMLNTKSGQFVNNTPILDDWDKASFIQNVKSEKPNENYIVYQPNRSEDYQLYNLNTAQSESVGKYSPFDKPVEPFMIDGVFAHLDYYDDETGTGFCNISKSSGPPIPPVKRNYLPRMVFMNNKWCMTGGRRGSTLPAITCLNSLNEWKELKHFEFERLAHEAIIRGDKLFICGGLIELRFYYTGKPSCLVFNTTSGLLLEEIESNNIYANLVLLNGEINAIDRSWDRGLDIYNVERNITINYKQVEDYSRGVLYPCST